MSDERGRSVFIGGRFCGPPGSGNGGYTAGTLAGYVGVGPCEVTLRKPPPLESALEVRVAAEGVVAYAGEELIATARLTEISEKPALWTAERGEYPGFTRHPFPGCYVCGPDHPNGLRIFPGRVGEGRTAAAWRVPADVTSAIVWAALDCPGGWTLPLEDRPSVLGRMAAEIYQMPSPGSECLIVGELRSAEGRKGHPVTSVYGPDGELLAMARATWIALA